MPDTIPLYPAFRPIEITDRFMLLEQFRERQPIISELSFANLFLFRHVHNYMLTSVDESLVITGCGYDGQPYFLPPLSGDTGEATRRLLADGKTLYGADDQFVTEHLQDGCYTLLADRDNDDYLYLRSELAELPGKRFHKKKNRISYFTARQAYRVEPYQQCHLGGALQLLDEWGRVHGDDSSRSLSAEIAAAREGLELADELGLFGVVVLTDKGVSAFVLGEKLNDVTAVCHFEKADPFLEGAAQLVNREFCSFLPTEYIFINREQDLGDSGLKAAKNSYHPVAMIRKFRVRQPDSGAS